MFEALEQALEGGEGVSWISLKHNIMGLPSNAFLKFRYRKRQAKQDNHGGGRESYNRTRGKKTYEGSVTCFMDTALALETNAPGGDALNWPPFEYIAQVEFNTRLYTIVLEKCEFTETGFDAAEGDMNVTMDLPLIVGKVRIREGI